MVSPLIPVFLLHTPSNLLVNSTGPAFTLYLEFTISNIVLLCCKMGSQGVDSDGDLHARKDKLTYVPKKEEPEIFDEHHQPLS